MEAIAFKATIKDGIIEIPEEYRGRLSPVVRVIVLSEEEDDEEDMIGRLLKNPLKIENFQPLPRDTIYGRE